MNRAEISEIKKLYTLKNCAVTRICGCYVNGDREIINTWSQPFLAMDEEDIFKYLDIFRKCLSGSLNKTLYNIHPGSSATKKLEYLKESRLKDGNILMDFYRHIINNYEYVGNYLILVIHDAYDVPGKAADGTEMEDASEEVYEYILSCICPVTLSRPGLGYDKEKSIFTHMDRDWILKDPENAILYPAFSGRCGDRETALYHARAMDTEKQDFAEKVWGATIEWTPAVEKEIYREVVDQVLGYDKTLQDVYRVNDITRAMADEKKEEKGECMIGREDIREILDRAGIRKERISMLDRIYTEAAGAPDAEIAMNNIVNRRGSTIKTSRGTITMKPDNAQYWEVMDIGGQPCLVLPLDDRVIDMDGIEIAVRRQQEQEYE